MNKKDKHRILELKSESFDKIDHLSILQELYDEYQEGNNDYYLLARYFVNGIDDLPKLKEKPLWNSTAFESHREQFFNYHNELVKIIDTYFDLGENELLVQEFHPNRNLKMIWIEKNGIKNGFFQRYFDNTLIAIESNYQNGIRHGEVKEWYQNGEQLEIGRYVNGNYIVEQFWDSNGNQLLTDGTGKTIRYYGTNDDTAYKQYFERYIFKGEKRIK